MYRWWPSYEIKLNPTGNDDIPTDTFIGKATCKLCYFISHLHSFRLLSQTSIFRYVTTGQRRRKKNNIKIEEKIPFKGLAQKCFFVFMVKVQDDERETQR